MPLHRFYAPPNTFSKGDKQQLSERITALYQEPAGLPAFYVVILFIDVEVESFYVGGQSTDRYVRITTQHIARANRGEPVMLPSLSDLKMPGHLTSRTAGCTGICILSSWIGEVWRAQGLRPPMPDTPAEKAWAKENRAISDEELKSMGVI